MFPSFGGAADGEREERVFKSFCDRIVHMGLQEEDEELVQQAFRRVL